jgi:hypothetical protein
MSNRQNYQDDEANSTEDTAQDNRPKVIDGRPCFRMTLLHDQEPVHERTLWSSIADSNRNVIFVCGSKDTASVVDSTVLIAKPCNDSWILVHAEVRRDTLIESLAMKKLDLSYMRSFGQVLTYMPNAYLVVQEQALEAECSELRHYLKPRAEEGTLMLQVVVRTCTDFRACQAQL